MPRFATTLATLALTIAFGATAFAQAPPAPTTRIRGTITSFTGGVLTVQGAASTYKITIPDNARVSFVVKSDLSKIGPNSYVGTVVVAQPDGSLRATEVSIFPENLRGVGEGARPWDTAPGGIMTNATVQTIAPTTVAKVDGRMMDLKYKDTEKQIFVPANVPIVTSIPADPSAFTPGAHVLINATTGADGTMTAAGGIQVGKDGLVPPM
ncbi:MAG TPA: hypothetical protein VGP41_14175 [Candidatus Lustribacter sp.]|nr:hypothetical protein [Candidatus Lustribacter sp.]